MNDCSSVRELLPAYLDHELSPSQRAETEMHLSGCPACQAELDELENDTRLLKATIGAPVVVRDRIADAVWAQIDAEDREMARAAQPAPQAAPKRSWGGFLRERLGISNPARGWAFAGGATAVAAALLLTFSFYGSHQPGPMDVRVASVVGNPLWHSAESAAWQPLSAGIVLHSGDSLKTDGDDKVTTAWSDGSRGVIGPDGEGTVLHKFPGMDLKQGRFWGRIKQQSKETPFTVRSPQATAQVVGTEFSVEVPATGKRTVLVVMQGAVHFFNAQGSITARDWSRSEAGANVAPTAPVTVSPLRRDSMWWVMK